jgi:hypothetical protein
MNIGREQLSRVVQLPSAPAGTSRARELGKPSPRKAEPVRHERGRQGFALADR